MEHIIKTTRKTKGLTLAQITFYNSVLQSAPYPVEVIGKKIKQANILSNLDFIEIGSTEDNLYYAKIPAIKFIIKIDSGKLDVDLDRIYSTTTILAPDFNTAFDFALDRWRSLFLGIELYDISAPEKNLAVQ